MKDEPSTENHSHTEDYKKALKKRMILMLIIVGSLLAIIFTIDLVKKAFIARMMAQFASTSVTISATKAESDTWTPSINAVGSLVAINGVKVSPEQPGMVTEIKFKSGETVQAGQPLVQLDTKIDEQDLNNFQAQLQLAQIKYDQQTQLYKTKATSQVSLDEAKAQLQEAQAAVQKTQVIIDQKTIKAPFSGKIGIRHVDVGQYVSPGDKLVSLQSMNPMYARFSLPEQNLKHLYMDQPIEVEIDNYPGQIFKGKINAIDATVDIQTRNILVEATLSNDQSKLYPGMFANIRVMLPTQEKVVTVPQTAVSFSLYGDSVFVIIKEGKDANGKPILVAHQRYVTTGNRQDNKVAITKGLTSGELIVTSGQLKLSDGTPVIINNKVTLPGMPSNKLQRDRT